MTENKRFKDVEFSKYMLSFEDNGVCKFFHEKDFEDWLNELHEENEKLQKENEKLKKRLKEKGDNLKEYYYDENGEKIESFDNEKLLTSLLQDIINELQNGWFVAEFESDFSNEVDINTLRTYAKNFCMKVSLRRTKPRELFF